MICRHLSSCTPEVPFNVVHGLRIRRIISWRVSVSIVSAARMAQPLAGKVTECLRSVRSMRIPFLRIHGWLAPPAAYTSGLACKLSIRKSRALQVLAVCSSVHSCEVSQFGKHGNLRDIYWKGSMWSCCKWGISASCPCFATFSLFQLFTDFIFLFDRWTWERAEENLHKMGQLSLVPCGLPHPGSLRRSERWQDADQASGGPLRRETGKLRNFSWLTIAVCRLTGVLRSKTYHFPACAVSDEWKTPLNLYADSCWEGLCQPWVWITWILAR